jgi:hypothetical protein
MNHLALSSCLAALIVFAIGCGKIVDEPATPLKGKLDAALSIRESSLRDDALAKVAQEAGAAGEVAVAKKAIAEIRESVKRDDAAAVCALKLAEQGRTSEATEIANQIRESVKRDATLAKIAKG